MKTLKYLLPPVLLLCVFFAFSQIEIKKSTEKIRIGDKVYYIHLVSKGETVYSLCRVYSVSQEELISENPQLAQGLKAGDRLKIPDRSGSEQAVAKTPANSARIEVDKDKKPEINNDVKTVASEAVSAIKHKIKSGETLVKIAQKYNCTVEDILKYNPVLDENSKLKKGQYLTIYPGNSESPQSENAAESATGMDIASQQTDETAVDAECTENLYAGDVLNVILILPLKVTEINANSTNSQRGAYDFVEFYEGFLLAIDSLNGKNIPINLTTFDVYDVQTLSMALNSAAFGEAQLVMGHVPKNLMDAFAGAVAERKIPVVLSFPHDTESITEKNRYFIQTITPLSFQIEKLNKILCEVRENIVVVYEEITDTASFDKFVKTLEDYGNAVKKYHYRLHGSRNENLQNELDKNDKNNIVVLSNNKVFVMDVLSKLNALSGSLKYDMTVYGLPQWKSFEESLNFEHIHNLNLSVIQASFVDYNRDEVKSFIGKYRYYYKGDPSRFSFHGYDLGIYFIDRAAKYGTDFPECIVNDEPATLLQTRFKFGKISPQGGLVNTESLLLQYAKDLNIVVE
ncbi:MAG: LysM peptidoglycan-binding domain-containing protein [Prevotellaceae bacterium]|jgi:LysM repeat protein|nr:LysM peptidoglycan-binding domain-containing protein [Prevotellaceae bacterium]